MPDYCLHVDIVTVGCYMDCCVSPTVSFSVYTFIVPTYSLIRNYYSVYSWLLQDGISIVITFKILVITMVIGDVPEGGYTYACVIIMD